ncbi:cobalamin biosynthesis protein CbiM [Chloroflexus islandicus]|uniref:Cobalamin biosynthesis protein CbiM n=1 Tax=Chloroflexus islandicus TaxID=1707952 RepID=A0A178MA21_9CHLR|nr:energy-coupling factor ABC transporter permease [Chloroflexus islandicus]OAN44885.1 cobalamin biosynthesis protein CbiM [Chloroflexus islandicus]
MWWQWIVERIALGLHIPDGFLHAPVALLWWLPTVIAVGIAARAARQSLDERAVPLMGVMAAFIFAAQMINVPIAGGTSGHLLGGVFAALVLGPWAGMVVMTSVIALQAILFQDGGIVAMGANIFNMGIATAAIGGWLARPLLIRNGVLTANRLWIAIVAAGAGWLSVMAAAALTSAQLVLSDLPAAIVFPAMLSVHAIIGIGEGLITAAAVVFLASTRPDLLQATPPSGPVMTRIAAIGVVIAAVITAFAPLASPDPDGLERVAEDAGFITRATDAPYQLLPDYTIPWLGETPLSTIIAGLVGVAVLIGLIWGMSRLLRTQPPARS